MTVNHIVQVHVILFVSLKRDAVQSRNNVQSSDSDLSSDSDSTSSSTSHTKVETKKSKKSSKKHKKYGYYFFHGSFLGIEYDIKPCTYQPFKLADKHPYTQLCFCCFKIYSYAKSKVLGV